jgi:hypothetical protein
MACAIGDRVGAFLGVREKVVDFLGYGIYEGDFEPVEAVGRVAELVRERPNHTSPRIKIDSGKVVYGCECWWGHEVSVKAQLKKYQLEGFTVKDVDIDEIRKQYKEEPPVKP